MARALLLSALLLAARAAPSSAALSAETVDSVLSKLGETGLFRLASPGGRRSLLDAGNTGDDLSAAQARGVVVVVVGWRWGSPALPSAPHRAFGGTLTPSWATPRLSFCISSLFSSWAQTRT